MSELQKKIDSIVDAIEKIKSRESNIYFFVQDTKGNPKGSVGFIYELVRLLRQEDYKAFILHDEEYKGATWLGETYITLPHLNIKKDFAVGSQDIIVVPEILSYVMSQLQGIPCIKVVLCQAYDYIFETLEAGASWSDFGFDRCITVSHTLVDFIKSFFPNVRIDIVNPFISDDFKVNPLPAKPLIGIHTRDQRDSIKIVKSFYTKYPQFRWYGFRDLRGLPRKEFGQALSECSLSVWIDDDAAFGTYPLESMKLGIPVIGKIPNKVPEWMTDDNGVWIYDETEIIDQIAKYIQHWLDDSVPTTFLERFPETIKPYSEENTKKQLITAIDLYFEKRVEALNEALTKLKEKLNEETHSNISDTRME